LIPEINLIDSFSISSIVFFEKSDVVIKIPGTLS